MIEKKVFLFTYFILISWYASGQNLTPPLQLQENLVGVCTSAKYTYLASNQALYQLQKNTWQKVADIPHEVTRCASDGKRIWLGGKGLYAYDGHQLTPFGDQAMKISSLLYAQQTQELIVASKNKGSLAINEQLAVRELMPNTAASAACLCGEDAWIGTYTGLYRLSKSGKIQKYAEEGVAGFEIPDNIVEQVYCTRNQTLTIIMPKPIAFINLRNGGDQTHTEHFDFLGSPDNQVLRQIESPKGDLFFLTTEGILVLSLDTEHTHTHEEDGSHHKTAKLWKAKQIENDPELREEIWQNGYFDRKGNLWLLSKKAVVKIPKKTVLTSLHRTH